MPSHGELSRSVSGRHDFIVVGAGSAGAVIAERLSANGRHRVLLIEEGPPDDNAMIRIPKGFARLLQDAKYCSRHPTDHARGSGAPGEVWLRGRTLGGSSAVNGMVWIRGQREDYDDFFALGNVGWSWDDLAPYFRKIENHALGENEWRGVGGPIEVGPLREPTRLGDAVIAAGEQLGLPRREDLNGPDPAGIGYHNYNIDRRGRRCSAAHGFLRPARRRPNLQIVTDTRIDRVLFENGRAVGVAGVGAGRPVEYRAEVEVVLCAGALASPRILHLSGVGPARHLQSIGVAVVHDNPAVGANMREHFLLTLQYRLLHWRDSYNAEFDGTRLWWNAVRYALFGRGPLSWGSHEIGAFTSVTPGSTRPDAQIMYSAYSRAIDIVKGIGFETEPGMHVFGYALRPESVGSVLIRSADPAESPRITPNYLSAPADRRVGIATVRFMRRLMAQSPLAPFVVGETVDTNWAQSDEQIIDAMLRLGRPGYHACGTCAMGQGAGAVVDERLRVRGVRGVRVMDCSIYPQMISGNTNAPTMAMAWRAADLILDDHR